MWSPLTNHPYLRCGLSAVAGFFVGIIATTFVLRPNEPQDTEAPQKVITYVSSNETVAAVTLARSDPLTLRVPSINLETDFVGALELNRDGTVEVPDEYDQVGWYKYGPTPGELGPAVILGHVDSFTGPAVFYNLRKLTIGDQIFIDRTDGTTAVFTVTEIETVSEKNFPTGRVYDSTLDYAGLRLITCTGTFDRLLHRYNHNLIIYAKLNPPKEEGE